MARVLIGWEFGANRGHAVQLARLASILAAHGHEVSLAVQRIDALAPNESSVEAIWQAPVSPRMLANAARPPATIPGTMGDILARLGLDDARLVTAMIHAWRGLIGATRAELVISEYAPFLLLAARGRLPGIAVGTGFQTPPAHLPAFPPILDRPPVLDERSTLQAANEGLAAAGADPLATLPALFEAGRTLTGSFAELDPYAGDRCEPPVLPVPADFAAVASAGEEVFVYAPETIAPDAPLWRGLAEAGLPTRVHVPRAGSGLIEALGGRRFVFEPEPLPIALIAERSRLLVSHGGHGFVSAGLAAGLPHIVCYVDLEKHFYGTALARHGLGGHVAMALIDPKAFGESLRRIYADDVLSGHARAAAPGFLARGHLPMEQALPEAVASLL